MLRLSYGDEIACIKNDGIVEYKVRSAETGCLVVAEAPSQTIMQLVLAAMPIVTSDVIRAAKRVKQLRQKVLVATTAANRARMDHNSAKLTKSELLAQLKAAEGALQLAKVASAG